MFCIISSFRLPQQLFNCQLLYRLSMPDNDLTVLPAAISNLINLRELDVSKNSKQNILFFTVCLHGFFPSRNVTGVRRVLTADRLNESCKTVASDHIAETWKLTTVAVTCEVQECDCLSCPRVITAATDLNWWSQDLCWFFCCCCFLKWHCQERVG